MKRLFVTGLVLLFPITITIAIAVWLFNLITDPLAGLLFALLPDYEILFWVARLLALISIFVIILLIGFLGRLYAFNQIFGLVQKVFKKIPFFRSIYSASQEVIETLLADENRGFTQVVQVAYPSEREATIGFIPRIDTPVCPTLYDGDLIPVIIPGCPNPLMGFILFFHKKDIHFLDMKVEDALKLHISAGAFAPK